MDFSKLNRAVTESHKLDPKQDIHIIFNKLLRNFPYTLKEKPKRISKQEVEEERFQTDLHYRFDLDY